MKVLCLQKKLPAPNNDDIAVNDIKVTAAKRGLIPPAMFSKSSKLNFFPWLDINFSYWIKSSIVKL